MNHIQKKVWILYTNASLASTYSLTVLTTLSEERPVIATLRKDSNTQWDFLLFLTYCIYQEYLCEGDYLIMDNATIHVGEDLFEVIELLIKAVGVKLVFLPTYSPELNAAEYVFQVTKTYIRNNRTRNDNLWLDIALGIATITRESMLQFYVKALTGCETIHLISITEVS